MVAGKTVAQNSILRVPNLYMRGNAPLNIFVNYQMVFHAILVDKYSNFIN